jgi:hypothetical protein
MENGGKGVLILNILKVNNLLWKALHTHNSDHSELVGEESLPLSGLHKYQTTNVPKTKQKKQSSE